MILRPYRVGDFVTIADVTGTVRAIGLFVTTVDTPDAVQTHIGNGKVLGGTIQNYSANPLRRVDLTAQLHHSVNVEDAVQRPKEKVAAVPHVSATTPPDVEVVTFTEFGPVLAVRPSTHTDHYREVYFATNKAILSVGAEGSFPSLERAVVLKSGLPAAAVVAA